MTIQVLMADSTAMRSSGLPKLTQVASLVDLAHQSTQHRPRTHFNIRCDALGRKTLDHGLPPNRRRHLPDERLDRR